MAIRFQGWPSGSRDDQPFCEPGLGRPITSWGRVCCEMSSLNTKLFKAALVKLCKKVRENLGETPMKEKTTFTAFGTKSNPKWACLNFGLLGVIVGHELFICKTKTAASTSLAILHSHSYSQQLGSLHLWNWRWFQHNYHLSHIKNLGRHWLQTCKDQKPLRFDLSKCIRHTCQKKMEWF